MVRFVSLNSYYYKGGHFTLGVSVKNHGGLWNKVYVSALGKIARSLVSVVGMQNLEHRGVVRCGVQSLGNNTGGCVGGGVQSLGKTQNVN